MRIWVDDVRSAPENYIRCKSVNEAIAEIEAAIYFGEVDEIELIDIDHDGGDYIRLLDWLEETGRNYPIAAAGYGRKKNEICFL